MVEIETRKWIKFNQSIGRTLDAATITQLAQQAAGQCGLPRAQVAVQPNGQTRHQHPRQARAQELGSGVVRQRGNKQTPLPPRGRGNRAHVSLNLHAQPTCPAIIAAMTLDRSPETLAALKPLIRQWGRQLGFSAVGFAPVELGAAEAELMDWLGRGFHGDMDYMARHGATRARPQELVPGTAGIISVRLDYLPDAAAAQANLADPARAYISRYALGRDYHKLVRARLLKLYERIAREIGPFQARPFADSAPVLEVALASRAALGWRGKHSLLLTRQGSWFFLGELFTDLPFPPDGDDVAHCGTCHACIDHCPTGAIVAPYQVDARRCISYLTIEHPGAIPRELRPRLGNRIYGCDDCQLACPWNRFAQTTDLPDFQPRLGLDTAGLIDLFTWSEAEFLSRCEGSAIRRIGHERWLRNLAVALGNAPPSSAAIAALQARADHPSALVREHLQWALSRQAENHEQPSRSA